MSKKTKRKIIKIAKKCTRTLVEFLESAAASIVHLIGCIAIGVGMATLMCWLMIQLDTRGIFTDETSLYMYGIRAGILCGAIFAVAKRAANFFTRLDIKREREERRLAELEERQKKSEEEPDDEERWSA